ncbi:aspartate-semialdehyde dehydrogenase [bacterium]|nr:aspartate-semialdehyde dehydrogenase [bacterium]
MLKNFQQAEEKIPVAVLGATGMVGQKFIKLMEGHPWFEIKAVAASANSAGKIFSEAVRNKHTGNGHFLPDIESMTVMNVEKDMEKISSNVRIVFSALNMEKGEIKKIEENYAAAGCAVISNNSANRWTSDIPMILPEINSRHTQLIETQRKNRGWTTGCIVVKPNCSIQSYMPVLEALKHFGPEEVVVSTYQAISGAGKTFETMPEIIDNVIPFIPGEEEKSEKEPLRIWGKIVNGLIEPATEPAISATCMRVPVSDGHMASVSVRFKETPTLQECIQAIEEFISPIDELNLPSAPEHFLKYFTENDRPQTSLDRDLFNGMGISVGRFRRDTVLDWKFACLSHNTIRGAAGGALLLAELLVKKGYVK